MRVSYEDMVVNPKAMLKSIAEFTGLDVAKAKVPDIGMIASVPSLTSNFSQGRVRELLRHWKAGRFRNCKRLHGEY